MLHKQGYTSWKRWSQADAFFDFESCIFMAIPSISPHQSSFFNAQQPGANLSK